MVDFTGAIKSFKIIKQGEYRKQITKKNLC